MFHLFAALALFCAGLLSQSLPGLPLLSAANELHALKAELPLSLSKLHLSHLTGSLTNRLSDLDLDLSAHGQPLAHESGLPALSAAFEIDESALQLSYGRLRLSLTLANSLQALAGTGLELNSTIHLELSDPSSLAPNQHRMGFLLA